MNSKKIVIIGSSAVGKTSIVSRYLYNKFNMYSDSTIGAAFATKVVKDSYDKLHKLEIWDTAGQERYKSLVPMYYRDADAAIIVYDITSKVSMIEATKWIHDLKSRNLKMIVVGNKYDLLDEVNILEIKKMFLDEHNIFVSAKTGDNIDNIFTWLVDNIPNRPIDNNLKVDTFNSDKYSLCC